MFWSNKIKGRKRAIIQLGDPVLRKQAIEISDVTSIQVKQVIADMQTTLADSNGVGIAAPQIGESLRIVIIASRPTPRYPKAPKMGPIVMINPSFDVLDQQRFKDWEGCLSIPGIRALVSRYVGLRVNYRDEKGKACEVQLQDFPAKIFQHEYDHLDGMVYLDRVENNRDIIAESEYLKLIDT